MGAGLFLTAFTTAYSETTVHANSQSGATPQIIKQSDGHPQPTNQARTTSQSNEKVSVMERLQNAQALTVDQTFPAWPYGEERTSNDISFVERNKRSFKEDAEFKKALDKLRHEKKDEDYTAQVISNYLNHQLTLLMGMRNKGESPIIYKKVIVPAHTKALIKNPLEHPTVAYVYEITGKTFKELYGSSSAGLSPFTQPVFNVYIRNEPHQKFGHKITMDTLHINPEGIQSHDSSASASTSSAH